MPPAAETEKQSGSSVDLKTLFATSDCTSIVFLSRVHSLLSQFLGGAWTKVPIENLQLKQLSGGLTNLLFLAQLPPEQKLCSSEPRNALIRIYAETNPEQLLQESIIFNCLSERKICPRLLGVFPGGRIERYIPSRTLDSNELCHPKYTQIIGAKLVDVHILEMPLNKNPRFLEQVRPWLKKINDTGNESIKLYATQAKAHDNEFPDSVKVNDLLNELDYIEQVLKKIGSPVVFCHNDIWEKNILLRDTADSSSEDPLLFIDYEAAAYNYRGFDFGQYFCAAGMDFDGPEPYTFHMEKFYDIDLRRTFCNAYLDRVYELKNSNEKSPILSILATGDREFDLDMLIKESFTFMPIANFFYGCWSLFYELHGLLRQGASEAKTLDYGAYGRDQLILYYQQKKYIEEALQNFD